MSITYFIAQKIRKAGTRTFTTMVHKVAIVSVAVGLTTMLVAFLALNGFQQAISHKLFSFHGHLRIFQYTLNQSYEELPIPRSKVENLKASFPTYIQDVQAFAHKTALLKIGEEVEGVVLKGLDVNASHAILTDYLIAGTPINCVEKTYSRDIIISHQTATQLNLQVGEEVIVYFVQQPPRYRQLRIAGIYSTAVTELDEKFIFCDLRLIQRLNHWPDSLVGGYQVFLKDSNQINVVEDWLWDWLDYDLNTQSTLDQHRVIFDWLTILQKNGLIFTVLILIVASSNIISIMLIQIMERTAMIGILKALGASNGQVQRTFLWSGVLLLAKGMLWGNFIGLGLAVLQDYFKIIRLDPTSYYVSYVPITWSWSAVIILNLLTFFVVTIVLLVPTAIIARIRPVQAIRFS